MRLTSAIFDMDGVLLDSNYIWRDLGPNYLRSHGLEPEADLRRILQPLSMEDTAVYFRTHYRVPRTDAEIVHDLTDIIHDEYTLRAPAKAGAGRMLALLAEHGIPVYVATATDRALAERPCAATVCCSICRASSPAPKWVPARPAPKSMRRPSPASAAIRKDA